MAVHLSRRAMLSLLIAPAWLASCGGAPATPTAVPTVVVPPLATPLPSERAASAPTAASGTAGAAGRASGNATADQIDLVGARRGGRLVEGWLNDLRTLNPLFVTDSVTQHATNLLFSGLVSINPDTLQPEGDLAERWTPLPDERGFLFSLRPNLKFHDGQPCTAEDVKFTYDLLLSERVNAPRQTDLSGLLESVNVKSPSEVELRLKQPFAPFLALHGGYGIVPKGVLGALEPGRIEQSEFSGAKPVGTGPFQIKQWTRGSALTLARYDGYHGGQPYLDEVVLKIAPDQELLQTQLKLGEVDLAIVRDGAVEELTRQQNLVLRRVDSLTITYLVFQLDPARSTLFLDKRARQALGLALDRETMLRLARSGMGRVGAGVVPPPSWAASEQLAGRLSYDPARAEQLLEGAGWRREADGIRAREGKRLSFELLTNRGSGGNRLREQYAQLMIDYWRKIGVEARLTLVDFQEVVTRLRRTHEFDVCLTAYALDIDPDQRLLWSTDAYKSGFNGGRFSNPALDKLMTDAVQTNDLSKRRGLYSQIQELLLDELPAIVIDYPQIAYGLNKRLRNVVPNPVSLAFAAHQWWVADGK